MQKQKTALVTGAAGGIGVETCKLLASKGYNLILVEVQVKKAINDSIQKYTKIDVLICLAGVIRPGLFEEVNMENLKLQMDVNFFGVVHFIHNMIGHFKKNSSGKIIVVSSLAGIVPAPKHNMYVASKFALRGLLQTLFLELKSFNIQVSNVMPDAILTPMLKYTATQDASPMA